MYSDLNYSLSIIPFQRRFYLKDDIEVKYVLIFFIKAGTISFFKSIGIIFQRFE